MPGETEGPALTPQPAPIAVDDVLFTDPRLTGRIAEASPVFILLLGFKTAHR
jgi:hypothetical protein